MKLQAKNNSYFCGWRLVASNRIQPMHHFSAHFHCKWSQRIPLIFVRQLRSSDAVVSFLQEFCLRKKFLQDARNLARILHLVKVKKVLVFANKQAEFAIFGQGEILSVKKMLKFLSFLVLLYVSGQFKKKKNLEFFFCT